MQNGRYIWQSTAWNWARSLNTSSQWLWGLLSEVSSFMIEVGISLRVSSCRVETLCAVPLPPAVPRVLALGHCEEMHAFCTHPPTGWIETLLPDVTICHVSTLARHLYALFSSGHKMIETCAPPLMYGRLISSYLETSKLCQLGGNATEMKSRKPVDVCFLQYT